MSLPGDISQVLPFLAGKKLNIAGFDEESVQVKTITSPLFGTNREPRQDLTDWITEAAGDIVYSDFIGVLDYLIVPVSWSGEAKQEFRHLVNRNWIEDCMDVGELLPVSYHHLPLPEKTNTAPLAGVVTCLSGYVNRERFYLNDLVSSLGGSAQVGGWEPLGFFICLFYRKYSLRRITRLRRLWAAAT